MQTAVADGVALPKTLVTRAIGSPRPTQRHHHCPLRPYVSATPYASTTPYGAAGAGE
ncbi:hypothetical protein [Streptomyces sp. NBC_01483]|uniref:hypothetical protein n=1 Tax=Streptomyces sp. NBC_01483 TaxID=2903883 RepID=UPI002E37A891|nr:hypothetical protein [Streptomyces sp. NBC_01483]